jgi:hypothetical protein
MSAISQKGKDLISELSFLIALQRKSATKVIERTYMDFLSQAALQLQAFRQKFALSLIFNYYDKTQPSKRS